MKYQTLGVIMHDTCNAECKICSLSCSPKSKNSLNIDRLKDFIMSCKNTSIVQVSFTGGEPFLRYEELKELIKFTVSQGFYCNVVTNAFWAYDENQATNIISELKAIGLSSINFSVDNFHIEYISKQAVFNAIKACKAYDLPVVVAMCKLKNERLGNLIDELDADYPSLNILINSCLPAGRSKQTIERERFALSPLANNLKCPYGGIVTIHPTGKIYPCCGHEVFATCLEIGDYEHLLYPDAIKKIRNNSILYILRNYGLGPFVQWFPDIACRGESEFASPCEICSNLFENDFRFMIPKVKDFIDEKCHNISLK